MGELQKHNSRRPPLEKGFGIEPSRVPNAQWSSKPSRMEAVVATVSSLAVYNHRRSTPSANPGGCEIVYTRCRGLANNKELINHHQQQGAVAPDAALPANQPLEDQSWKISNLRYRY